MTHPSNEHQDKYTIVFILVKHMTEEAECPTYMFSYCYSAFSQFNNMDHEISS